jgi:hypothetical protein
MLSLPWGGTPPAWAQEAIGAGIAENIAAGSSATDFGSRLRIRTAYLSLPGDPWLVATRLSGTYAPHPSVALRLQLPLTYADPGFLWDLEDDLPTDDTMTLGLEVGKQVTDRVALSGKPAIQVYGSEEFAWAFELSFTFRFD